MIECSIFRHWFGKSDSIARVRTTSPNKQINGKYENHKAQIITKLIGKFASAAVCVCVYACSSAGDSLLVVIVTFVRL